MVQFWQLQMAKARFSELVKKAQSDGPQVITYRGVDTAVLVSIDDFRRMESNRPSFKDALLSGPTFSDDVIDLINDRSRDTGRDIKL
jgi:prevent-host-death family protein